VTDPYGRILAFKYRKDKDKIWSWAPKGSTHDCKMFTATASKDGKRKGQKIQGLVILVTEVIPKW
jgi:hypothetical protein